MKKKLVGIVLCVLVAIALVGCGKKQSEDGGKKQTEDGGNWVKREKCIESIFYAFSTTEYKDNCNVFYSESDNAIIIELNDIYDMYTIYQRKNGSTYYSELWGNFDYSVISLCQTCKQKAQSFNLDCDVIIKYFHNGRVFYSNTNGEY